jgi:hypothetical protein
LKTGKTPSSRSFMSIVKSLLSKLALPLTKPTGALMNLLFQNVAKKFLASFLKALIALVVAVAAAIGGLDPVAIVQAAGAQVPDQWVLGLWGLIGALLTACVSALKRLATFDASKVK